MSGLLIGTVRTAAGTLIPNASVTVTSVPVVMSSGYYRGWIMSTGAYAITASAPGYAAQTVSKALNGSGVCTLDFVVASA